MSPGDSPSVRAALDNALFAILIGPDAPSSKSSTPPRGVRPENIVTFDGDPVKARAKALDLARARGAQFVFFAARDACLLTDVVHELMAEMLEDATLAIVGPSFRFAAARTREEEIAWRFQWDLRHHGDLEFGPDFAAPEGSPFRLEADYCDLTFALARVAALDSVGGFDPEFQGALADADLAFRLRAAGFNCASLPGSQVGVEGRGAADLASEADAADRRLFALNHLGFGVGQAGFRTGVPGAPPSLDPGLRQRLLLDGLLDATRPDLLPGWPEREPAAFAWPRLESGAPAAWLAGASMRPAIFAPSRWARNALTQAGFERVFHAPRGVATDIYRPDGDRARYHDGPTFLWFARHDERAELDVMLEAWSRFSPRRPDARLVVMGRGVLAGAKVEGSRARRWKQFDIVADEERRVAFHDQLAPLSDTEKASIFRSVDVFVCSSRAESSPHGLARAMACGTLAIFPEHGGTADLAHPGALTFGGVERAAPGQAGTWLEPDTDAVARRMEEACDASPALARTGVRVARGRFDLRHASFAIRAGLAEVEEPKDILPPTKPGYPVEQFAIDLELAARAAGEVVDATVSRPSFEEIDKAFYRSIHMDVAGTGIDPVEHYILHGWREERKISDLFNTRQYLAGNAGVRRFLLDSIGLTPGATRPAPNGDRHAERAAALEKRDRWRLPAFLGGGKKPRRRGKGALFIGYVEANLGIGESSRGLLRSLDPSARNFAIYPFNMNVENRYLAPFMPERYDRERAYSINVFEMACDQLPLALKELGEERVAAGYNILRTGWELPEAPAAWRANLAGIDEIWAYSDYVAEAFRPVFDGEIRVFPVRVDATGGAAPSRGRFGLAGDRFYFMFSFDYFSSQARKNPLAVIEAFARAFPDPATRVGLVVKSVGAEWLGLRTRREIERRAAADDRLVLVDRTLERGELLGLMATADCYVSLHRSEGFGLGMTEAMALGKPVIGTDYSGSRDFLSEETGWPVKSAPRRVRHGEYPWCDGQFWVEPDVDHAAARMREVLANPDESQRRSRAAAAFVEKKYGAAAVRAAFEQRIGEIGAMLRSRA